VQAKRPWTLDLTRDVSWLVYQMLGCAICIYHQILNAFGLFFDTCSLPSSPLNTTNVTSYCMSACRHGIFGIVPTPDVRAALLDMAVCWA
jgi:hypothetical protein